MKILITGAQGMLGWALSNQCKKAKIISIPLGKKEADITNLDQLRGVFQKYQPTHVINSAAYTKVDLAETEKEQAFAVNAIGAKNIAVSCWEQDIKLLHISTDYVFDGKTTEPYTEESPVNPLCFYGSSKAQGELWVQQENPEAQIVRLQALYGENGSHFIQTMLRLSRNNPEIQVVTDQLTSPSYTRHIAKALLQLLHTDASGIFHLHNQGTCSWYDFAKEIFSVKQQQIQLRPVLSEDFPRPALRPLHSQLSMNRWEKLGLPLLPHWKQALQEYLKSQEQVP